MVVTRSAPGLMLFAAAAVLTLAGC
ncbi:MAG: hypothetical protein QOH67_1920, partial [Hyphomicrobiales bacterium]|nr:hypothetical protein [Hyphomicrobiales bacterium]